MCAVIPQQESLFPGPPKRRAVGETLTEVGVPRIEVGIEMDQGERAVALGHRAQEGQGNGVIAANGHQPATMRQERVRPLLNLDTAVSMSNGEQVMSPASTTWPRSNGKVSNSG
jgi:hypothetical protein